MIKKKWTITRIAHSSIEVESETRPVIKNEGEFEQKHLKEFEENYTDDGWTAWEIWEA